ncbi:hypothetical protein TRV_02062 [Trichophyton verrucosum HKI 0517]|uniref:Uncharacterized protein n=1 Tax=Trichophyton verrucosum (strain HKI 0517) TaxID=663202 RepID=D4D4P6_TRIVH|nr:uncharacterized protein TRV_02062 [Trichophyton verrucosum HKI 0517]EFE43181.1 hypothetical protein TRV_02062 [Trichophyton verrucosum HKI 0517]
MMKFSLSKLIPRIYIYVQQNPNILPNLEHTNYTCASRKTCLDEPALKCVPPYPLMYIVTVNTNIYRLISSLTTLLRIRIMVVLPDVVQPAGRIDRQEERQARIPNARVISSSSLFFSPGEAASPRERVSQFGINVRSQSPIVSLPLILCLPVCSSTLRIQMQGTRALFLTGSNFSTLQEMIPSQYSVASSEEKIAPSGSSSPFFFLRFLFSACCLGVVMYLLLHLGALLPTPFWQNEDFIFKAMRDVQRIILLLLLHPPPYCI